jgi:hypothetical protein
LIYHRGTESTEQILFSARSGDGDRTEEISPLARYFATEGSELTLGLQKQELPPEAEALFSGRRLPAREKLSPQCLCGLFF